MHIHFPDTFVEVNVPFHLTDLVDGQLKYTTFAILAGSLLSRYIESSLRLDCSLLNLSQDLKSMFSNVLEYINMLAKTFLSVSSDREAMKVDLTVKWMVVNRKVTATV